MAPQQDPTNPTDTTPDTSPQAEQIPSSPQPETPASLNPAPDTTTPSADTELRVDDNGFVSEPTPAALDSDPSINEQEPFQSQLTPAPQTPAPKKSKKKFFVIIGAIVALLLLGGTATALFWYNAPDKVVGDALGRMVAASSVTSKGTLKVDAKDADGPNATITYDMAFNDTALSANTIFDIATGDRTVNLKADIVTSKDALAIKLPNAKDVIESAISSAAPDGQTTDIFDDLIALVDNKWIVITKDDLGDYTQDENANKQLTCTQDALAVFRTDKAQQSQVSDIYRENKFITVLSKGTETVNGKMSNHYELTFDETKADQFIDKLKDTTVFKAIDTCYEGELSREYDENKAKATGDSQETVTSKLELWVDVVSHNPTKMRATMGDDEATIVLESTIELNNAPQIDMPAAETSLKDLQDEFMNIQQAIMGPGVPVSGSGLTPPVLGVRTFGL